MSIWRRLVEARIEAARKRGEFEGLSGKGQPLDLNDNPLSDPSWRLAHHILENADISPPWVAMAKEIREEIADLRAAIEKALPGRLEDSGAAQQQRERFYLRIATINRRLLEYNLTVPHTAFQIPALDPERELHLDETGSDS